MALVILYGLLSTAALNMFIVPAAYFRFAHTTITGQLSSKTSKGTFDASIREARFRVRVMACSDGGDDRRKRLGRFPCFRDR